MYESVHQSAEQGLKLFHDTHIQIYSVHGSDEVLRYRHGDLGVILSPPIGLDIRFRLAVDHKL